MADAAKNTSAMTQSESEMINAVIYGIVRTLQIHCSVDAERCDWKEKEISQNADKDYIILFGVMGQEITACVNIEFSKPFLLDLMGSMLGELITELTPEIEDEILSLVGFIFRKIKRQLNQAGEHTHQLIPMVIKSSKMKNSFLSLGRIVNVPIDTSVGSFNVELGLGTNL